MTAQSIGIFTIDFPDPYEINYYNDKFTTLTANISFQYPITSNIQTLSAKDVERGNDPYGILFVPTLSSDDCKKSEQSYVPTNATRLTNLPTDTDYALIAFAPWFSPTCMIQYFQAARTSPVKAFLVYQPGTSNDMPPVMNDPSWYLGDGGSWKMDNKFPTYALASVSGGIIAEQMGKYSGNITDVPNGHELASEFSPTDYVRLWATVNTDPGSQLPSLWVFLVIVLGLLILVIGATSGLMHIVQRRRRNSLRQRVVNGEVDLEALGVKRLTVPRDFLEKLPLYAYTAEPDDAEKTLPQATAHAHNMPSPTIDAETGAKSSPLGRRISAPTAADPANRTSIIFSQSTCSICLDDFEPNESQVRELPCRHIFHADCIDPFLLSNSSLCPLCKSSVLPTGYCPPRITNVMVRRERMIRRRRAQSAANESAANANADTEQQPPATPLSRLPGRFGSLGSRVGRTLGNRRIFSAPARTQQPPADIEMAGGSSGPPAENVANPVTVPEITPAPTQTQSNGAEECATPPSAPPAHSVNRREWARQRAMTLLGNRNVPSETEDEETTGPRWKRSLRKIFPGFR